MESVVSIISRCPPVIFWMPRTVPLCCNVLEHDVARTCNLLLPLSWWIAIVLATDSLLRIKSRRPSAKHHTIRLIFSAPPTLATELVPPGFFTAESTFLNWSSDGALSAKMQLAEAVPPPTILTAKAWLMLCACFLQPPRWSTESMLNEAIFQRTFSSILGGTKVGWSCDNFSRAAQMEHPAVQRPSFT